MKLVNLTPHAVVLRPPGIEDDNSQDVVIPSVGCVRCASSQIPDGVVNGWPITKTHLAPPLGLPEPQDGVVYIVSYMVANAMKDTGRSDIVAPDTSSSAVRDSAGNVIAVRGFTR